MGFLAVAWADVVVTDKKLKGPSTSEMKRTDKDVTDKLNQLHKVIDALHLTVKNMSEGHNKSAQESAKKMKTKFGKLSTVISKLTKHNNQLYGDNKRLRQEKNVLVDKISNLEIELQRRAEAIGHTGAEAWLKDTASELKTFLEESGLEHFASPRFSPLVAGIVSNGVVIIPLGMTSLFLLRYVKQLTVLRIVMALNLFDLGFAIAIIASSALLLGDPFEGMRHISEVNFVFIQLILGGVFWLTFGFLVAAIFKNRNNKGWKYALGELGVRTFIAVDYGRRVWIPVMERDDLPIALPALFYILYLGASIVAVHLTSMASWHSVIAQRQLTKSEDRGEVMVSLVTQHSD